MRARSQTLAAAILLAGLAGCKARESRVDPDAAQHGADGAPEADSGLPCLGSIIDPIDTQRVMPNWPQRPYDLHLPASYTCTAPTATVLFLHGGGANKDNIKQITCPDGNLESSQCFDAVADREGVAVVYVNGTSNPVFKSIRTFNAGGCPAPLTAECPWTCVSGHACENEIDEASFFDDLIADLSTMYHVDRSRIYATGISNGAAMSHTLACTAADTIAAIAPVAGGNQYSVNSECTPSRPVPVLSFHGTADEGWPFLGGETANPNVDGDFIAVSHEGVADLPEMRSTVGEWSERNGCSDTPDVIALPDSTDDGTTVTRYDFNDCDEGGDVSSLVITGGGHTWPGGYSPIDLGLVSGDINANEAMIAFFLAHSIGR